MAIQSSPLALLRAPVFFLVGFTLPFEYTAIDIAGFPLTPNKAVAALLVGFVALQWALERRAAPPDPKRWWVLFLGVAVVVGAVQSVLAGLPYSVIQAVVNTWVTLFIFYFVLGYVVTSRRSLDMLLWSFVLGCVAAAITGWLGFGAQIEGARYGDRLTGEGGNPNLLAFNLLVAISAAASLWFTSRRALLKPLYLAAIAVMLAAVALSLSRTAYVTVFGMAVLWAVRFRRLDFLRYAAPFLLLLGSAVFLVPDRVVDRFFSLSPDRIEEDVSAHDRIRMLPGIAKAFASNPITGVGLLGYKTWAYRNDEVVHVIHNGFLQVLTEHGLLGFIPYVVICILSWRELGRAWRVSRRVRREKPDPELRVLEIRAILLQIGLGGAYLMSLGQPTMRHKGLWMLFALATVTWTLVRARVRQVAPELETRTELEAVPGYQPLMADAEQR